MLSSAVEHRLYTAEVRGSNPLASTIYSAGNIIVGRVAKWPNAADCKSVDFRLRRFESTLAHHFLIKTLRCSDI